LQLLFLPTFNGRWRQHANPSVFASRVIEHLDVVEHVRYCGFSGFLCSTLNAFAFKAADSLQTTSGIQSRTLASLEASWKSGYEQVGVGDIVVIDEAGMVGTRQLGRVAEQLRMRGCMRYPACSAS
jgi:hypothetical protein